MHNLSLKKSIKHELVHAKQFETIARSKDGIKKLNFAVASQTANSIKDIKGADEFYSKMVQEIKQDNIGKYNNLKINMNGSEVDAKKYITAVNTLIQNKDATYNDIPIFINEKHYQEVIDKEGGLTLDEEKKADEYFKALSEYSAPKNTFEAFNPFGEYRNNILEREAYEATPSIFKKIFSRNKS